MKGLKGHASDKFIRFFEVVQQAAHMQNSVFFSFAGEGREFHTASMEGEDMSGWLVPNALSNQFESEWTAFKRVHEMEHWADYFTFVIWEQNNTEISVIFRQYD